MSQRVAIGDAQGLQVVKDIPASGQVQRCPHHGHGRAPGISQTGPSHGGTRRDALWSGKGSSNRYEAGTAPRKSR